MKEDIVVLPSVFLKMGEIYITTLPTAIMTVLGSCVSICMYHKESEMGGMCHGLLPNCRDPGECDKNVVKCFKYVDCSIWYMIDQFEKYGIPRRSIEAKMFGGANTFSKFNYLDIGTQNVEAAKKAIHDAGMNLSAFNLGGNAGRKIIFYTHTGEILMKMLNNHFIDKSI